MIRSFLCVLSAFVWTALMFNVACLAMLVTWNTSSSIWVARRLWSPVLLWVAGISLSVEGLEHVDPSRPAIYLSNHQSGLDIPALFVALPVNLRFVAKKQLQYVPFLGWYLYLARHILIDRRHSKAAIASLEDAGRQIRGGVSIIAFPEGTRSEDGTILPFKKGPFALAVKAGVPVYPIAIEGTASVMPKGRWTITPGPVRVRIGRPLDASRWGEPRRDELIHEVRGQIIEQHRSIGGRGGDLSDGIAARGVEGHGPPARARRSSGDSGASAR